MPIGLPLFTVPIGRALFRVPSFVTLPRPETGTGSGKGDPDVSGALFKVPIDFAWSGYLNGKIKRTGVDYSGKDGSRRHNRI